MMETRYFMHCAYDGTSYHGWQKQPNATGIQQILEAALATLSGGVETEVIGAGRTDTGVHATKYFAHFNLSYIIEDETVFARKLNGILPDDIAVYHVFRVNHEAHARFSATARQYHYRIIPGKNPFENRWAGRFHQPLNLEFMREASKMLIGKKDFGCFAKSRHGAENTICEVFDASWRQEQEVLVFDIRANRFLRNMVRAIVGTLLDVGTHKITLRDFQDILESGDRKKAGVSVPPQGLFLVNIEYPNGIIPPHINQLKY
jgi:tRNA pseudouridine38-40 synthase